jgi:toxin ParE1/3/4
LHAGRWTHFGPRQAAVYEDDLIARCNEITAVSQGCRRLIAADLPENLRFTRSGQHFIVFIEDATQVTIVDVLHSRADLPGKLAFISDPKSDPDT